MGSVAGWFWLRVSHEAKGYSARSSADFKPTCGILAGSIPHGLLAGDVSSLVHGSPHRWPECLHDMVFGFP